MIFFFFKRALSKHQSAKKIKYGVVFVAKKGVKACSGCSKKFSLMVGKNHCRKCGGVFCSGCTKTKLLIKGSKNKKRICDSCVEAGCRQSTFAETDILHKDEKEEEEEEIAAINEDSDLQNDTSLPMMPPPYTTHRNFQSDASISSEDVEGPPMPPMPPMPSPSATFRVSDI